MIGLFVYFDCSAILFVLQKWVDVDEKAVFEMWWAWRDVSRWFSYCVTNMGGKEVKCPLCLGERFIDVDEILNKTKMDSKDVKKRRRKAKISEVRESEES